MELPDLGAGCLRSPESIDLFSVHVGISCGSCLAAIGTDGVGVRNTNEFGCYRWELIFVGCGCGRGRSKSCCLTVSSLRHMV